MNYSNINQIDLLGSTAGLGYYNVNNSGAIRLDWGI